MLIQYKNISLVGVAPMAKRGTSKRAPLPKAGGPVGKGGMKIKKRPALPATLSAARPNQLHPPRQGGKPKFHAAAPKAAVGRHTILLQQPTSAAASRTWNDFDSTPKALDFFTNGYERELRKLNPGSAQLTYTVADLHVYVDSLHDLSILVADPQTKQYAPKGKEFIKQQLMDRIKQAANK
ncbi:hypothetical protein AB1Y20_021440 [Prymnesium parvum]|uniref:Enhancer of rudimentary homolog n=1 Tax=Prymnesium parvum TaxID=97485 RepID=A0AB34JKL2_PRYPA